VYYEELWDYYWLLRRGESILCSEILAYKQLTGMEIEKYEVDVLLTIDNYVSARLEHHRKAQRG
jgi:hypothetical protein